jgi:hypothetical protein
MAARSFVTGVSALAGVLALSPLAASSPDAVMPAVQLTSGESVLETLAAQHFDFSDAFFHPGVGLDSAFADDGATNLQMLVSASTEALNAIFSRAVNGSINMPQDMLGDFLNGLLGADPDDAEAANFAADSVDGYHDRDELDAASSLFGGGSAASVLEQLDEGHADGLLDPVSALPGSEDGVASELHDLLAGHGDLFGADVVGPEDASVADLDALLDPSHLFG